MVFLLRAFSFSRSLTNEWGTWGLNKKSRRCSQDLRGDRSVPFRISGKGYRHGKFRYWSGRFWHSTEGFLQGHGQHIERIKKRVWPRWPRWKEPVCGLPQIPRRTSACRLTVGEISVGAGSKPAHLIPNQYAEIVHNTWFDLPNHIPNIVLDEFIIMPNHIHGIIRIFHHHSNRAGLEPAPTVGVPEMVRQLKTFSARRINKQRNTIGQPIWQRNYFEHIIREEKSLYFIRKYIQENPANWQNDMENHIDKELLNFQMSEIGDAK